MLLERLAGAEPPEERIFNVATGQTVAIRSVIERLSAIAGVQPVIEVDPSLVRSDDPPVIRGDAARLRSLVGWRPEIPLDRTLADVMAEALVGDPGGLPGSAPA